MIPHTIPHATSPAARVTLLACLPLLVQCASTPKEVALHTSIPTPSQARQDEGVALRTSVRAARPDRALSLTPTASFGVSTQTQITLALGVDLRLRLEERQLDLPLPLMFSVGFDALNMGCQGLPMCHIGAAGVHGEVGAIIARHHTYGDWSLSVGLDQDIRFGPRSNTSLLAGVRWTPARQNQ